MKIKITIFLIVLLLFVSFLSITYADSETLFVNNYFSYSTYSTYYNSSSIFTSLFFVALWSLIPGFIAKHKGRSFAKYFFLSFLITPLITMIIALCVKNLNKTDGETPYSIEKSENQDDGETTPEINKPVKKMNSDGLVSLKDILEYSLKYQTTDSMILFLKLKKENLEDEQKRIITEVLETEPLEIRSKIKQIIDSLES